MKPVNTKVDLRFTIWDATWWIPSTVIEKVVQLNSNRINKKGELIISSERHRTQAQNKQDCIQKLHALLVEAADAEIAKPPDEEKIKKIEE